MARKSRREEAFNNLVIECIQQSQRGLGTGVLSVLLGAIQDRVTDPGVVHTRLTEFVQQESATMVLQTWEPEPGTWVQ